MNLKHPVQMRAKVGDLLCRIGDRDVSPMTKAEIHMILESTYRTQQSTYSFMPAAEYAEEQRLLNAEQRRISAAAKRQATATQRRASTEQLSLQIFGFFACKVGAVRSPVVVTVVNPQHAFVIEHNVTVGLILFEVNNTNASTLLKATLDTLLSTPGPLLPIFHFLSLEQYNDKMTFLPIVQVRFHHYPLLLTYNLLDNFVLNRNGTMSTPVHTVVLFASKQTEIETSAVSMAPH